MAKFEFIFSKQSEKFFEKHIDVEEKFILDVRSYYNKEKEIDICQMNGILKGTFRIRIGKYRIIFKIKKGEVVIVDVLFADSRGSIYKNN